MEEINKPNYLKKLFFINNFHNFNKHGILYNQLQIIGVIQYFQISIIFSASKS